MSVNRTDLGATVCRALLREMADKPVRLDIWAGAGQWHIERTGQIRVLDQWTVRISPTLEYVSVVAQGRYQTLIGCDTIPIPGDDTTEAGTLLIAYPKDSAEITGDEYAARLREAVERALVVCEADYAAAASR